MLKKINLWPKPIYTNRKNGGSDRYLNKTYDRHINRKTQPH